MAQKKNDENDNICSYISFKASETCKCKKILITVGTEHLYWLKKYLTIKPIVRLSDKDMEFAGNNQFTFAYLIQSELYNNWKKQNTFI